MSTERFSGFAGPSYATLSPAEAVERSLNYYFEAVEVPHNPKTDAVLYQRPGSRPFGSVPPVIVGPVRGQLQFDGNGVLDGAMFGVTGSTFWQMNPDGSQTSFGSVVDDGKPAFLAANAASVGQVFVASGGRGYCLNSGVFAEIPISDDFFGARDVCFIDGYFVVLSQTANNQQFQISALNDGTTWSGIDVAILLGQADPLQRVLTNIEYLYFIGSRRGEIWYNSGNALFPFTIESGAFLEFGTNALGSGCQASNGQSTTIYWLGQDARGGNIAMCATGLSTTRISDHAVEAAWANKDPQKFNGQVYPTTDDCVAYPFTWNGHAMVRFIFPTAGAGWDYDITESARVGFKIWNPVSFTDQNGNQTAPFERAHAFAFGLHLIGSGGADGQPGQIYAMDSTVCVDCLGAVASQQGQGSPGTLTTATISPTATEIETSFSTLSPAPFPFYFTIGGSEICQCTLISFPDFWVIRRGLFGSTAQTWTMGAVIQVVTFRGFPLTRDRIVRLPFNNGYRSILDQLEILAQAGVGVVAANTIFSAAATLGSNTFAVADTTALQLGQVVSGVPVVAGSNIQTITANTSIVLNTDALANGTFPLTALDPTPGANPVIALRMSRDGGQSWEEEILLPLGPQGQTRVRAIIQRLGYYRDGAIWLRVTDPVFVCLTGASHALRMLGS